MSRTTKHIKQAKMSRGLMEWDHAKVADQHRSGFSSYKRIMNKIRRHRINNAVRDDKEVPDFPNSNRWDWF